MDYTVEKEEYKEYKIRIEYDTDSESPREWSNLGTMACWHRKYTLGDIQPKSSPQEYMAELWGEYGTDEEIREMVNHEFSKLPLSECKWLLNKYVYYNAATYDISYRDLVESECFEHPAKCYPDNLILLPVYMYEHSGICLNTSGYSCPWDSGQLGIIYVSKSRLEKEKLSDKTEEEVKKYLQGEVEAYSQYVGGEVYGFVVEDKEGEWVDSCWGFYGYDYCLESAKEVVDSLVG